MQLNNDTGPHYDYVLWTAPNVAPSSSLGAVQAVIGVAQGGVGAGQFSTGWLEIFDYDQVKHTIGFTGQSVWVNPGFIGQYLNGGRWTIGLSTSYQAVTSLQIFPSVGNFADGTHFTTEIYP
jgi:hypothetical protein